MKTTTTAVALFAGLAAASIWGGMYVVSKVVLEVIPPFALLSLRLILGFLALAAVARARGGFRATRRQFAVAFSVGIVGYGVSLGFQFVGTKLSTASAGALVTAATPALVLPCAALLLKERITARRLIALLIATAGVVAVVAPWNAAGGAASAAMPSPAAATTTAAAVASASGFLGKLLLVVAAATWALYSTLVRRTCGNVDLLSSSAIMLLGGLPTSLLLGAYELATTGIGTITTGVIAGVLFLGIVSTAAAMFLWNYAFAKLPAQTASLTFFAQPVVGTLLGWAFLGESIAPSFAAGGLCIGAALMIARKE